MFHASMIVAGILLGLLTTAPGVVVAFDDVGAIVHNGFTIFGEGEYHQPGAGNLEAEGEGEGGEVRNAEAQQYAELQGGQKKRVEKKNRGLALDGAASLLSHRARDEAVPVHAMLGCKHGTRAVEVQQALAAAQQGSDSPVPSVSLVQKAPPVYLVVVDYGTFHRFLKHQQRQSAGAEDPAFLVLWEEIHPHSKISSDLHPMLRRGRTPKKEEHEEATAGVGFDRCPKQVDLLVHLIHAASAQEMEARHIATSGERWPKDHCWIAFGAKERQYHSAVLAAGLNASAVAAVVRPLHRVVRVLCDLTTLVGEQEKKEEKEEGCETRARFTADLLSLLSHSPWTHWVEPRPHFQNQNNVATVTLQSPTLTNRPLWAHRLTGKGQVAQVGDTGLDFDHCFFRDVNQAVKFYPETNPAHRKVLTYVECDNDVHIDHADAAGGHGTHVAGSVAGNAVSAENSNYNGMAKDAKLVFSDMNCGHGEEGVYPPGDIHDYYSAGYGVGARATSNSWGVINKDKTYSATERNSDHFAYHHPDFLLVYAAGNYANSGIITPSSGKNMLTVGAHQNSLEASKRELISGFSAIGPAYDGKVKPEVMAPGQQICSAKSDGLESSNQCDVFCESGTSMATPLVAGSSLLLRQYLQEGYYPSGERNYSAGIRHPTASLLKAALVQATVPMTQESGWPSGHEGFGRLELGKMMYLASGSGSTAGTSPYTFLVNNDTIAHAVTRSYCFTTTSSTPSAVSDIKATLTWTDPPLVPEGSKKATVVNDLDLTLVNAAGQTIHPNGKNDFDRHINNVEVISTSVTAGAASGKFILHVHGHHVEDEGMVYASGQPFSLVAWAPNLQLAPDSVCKSFKCPKDCSGHGSCVEGRCQCNSPYHHIDCAVCNAKVQCHGNGVCDAKGVCTCNPNFDVAADPTCGKCKAGWFGPHCNSRCDCGHGVCNLTTGACICQQTNKTDSGAMTHYDGPQCGRCAFDWYGAQCNQRSHWCMNKKLRVIGTNSSGIVQLNGEGRYINGDACGWRIVTPNPSWTIRLKFLWFDIEKQYDHLRVYDGPDRGAKLMANYDGRAANGKEITTTGNQVLLMFRSDYIGPGGGFTVEYSVLKNKCKASSCHGHGRCDARTDLCVCLAGFDASKNCEGCADGFEGASCSTPVATTPAPTVPDPFKGTVAPPQKSCVEPGMTQECSGHGYCHSDTHTCECDTNGYQGDYCERTCPAISLNKDQVPTPCAGHGLCGSDVTCMCQDNYLGRSCQVSELQVQWLNVKHSSQRLVLEPGTLTLVGYHPILPQDEQMERSVIVRMALQTIPSSLKTSKKTSSTGKDKEKEPLDYSSTTGTPEMAPLPPVEYLLWADALDVGLDAQAIHKSDFMGHHCVESKGWSSTPLAPTVMGVRSKVATSVEVTFSQRVVPRCGATGHSVCSTTMCTVDSMEGSGGESGASIVQFTPVPVQTRHRSVGDQIAAAFRKPGHVALAVLAGVLLGMALCLGIHCYLYQHARRKYARMNGGAVAVGPGGQLPEWPGQEDDDEPPTAGDEMDTVATAGSPNATQPRSMVYQPKGEGANGNGEGKEGDDDALDELEGHNEPLETREGPKNGATNGSSGGSGHEV